MCQSCEGEEKSVRWVEVVQHALRFGLVLDRLVEDLNHAHVPQLRFGMDEVGHPFQEF